MLAPVLLFATYTTFGPIAQDAASLYIADGGSIVRVDKDDPSKRTTLTAPISTRIAAIDVDGGRVVYATAPTPDCKAVPTFPPAMFYVHYICSLTADDSDYELRSVSIVGGDDQSLFHSRSGVTEIEHDSEWMYWLSPSTALAPGSGILRRKNNSSGAVDTLADSLVVSAVNQHPFAVADDAVYVVSHARLLRVPKSGGAAVDVAEVDADTSIAIFEGILYFVRRAEVHALDTRTGHITTLRVRMPDTAGATYPIAILGAAPGLLLTSDGAGWTHTAFRGWSVNDLCTQTPTLLGSKTSDIFHDYFIFPLTEPPIAVDSRGIYIGGRRVLTFATPPSDCRRRAAGH